MGAPLATLAVAAMALLVVFAGCAGPSSPVLRIQSFYPTEAPPAALVTVRAEGLDAAADPHLVFESGTFTWPVRAVDVGPGEAVFAVPPFVSGNAWASGAVSLRLTQGTARSEAVPGFMIQALPSSPLPPGFLTWAVLDGLHDYANSLEAGVTELGPGRAAAHHAFVAKLGQLSEGIAGVQNGSRTSLDLGVLLGQPTDPLLAAWLASPGQAVPDESPSLAAVGWPLAARFADETCAAGKNFDIGVRVEDYLEGGESIYARHLKSVVGGTPCASNKALEVIGATGGMAVTGLGAVGVTGSAMLLPSLALSTITTTVAAWQVALGMHLRGLHDAASRALLDSGVQKLDEQLGKTLQDLATALKPFQEPPTQTWPEWTPPPPGTAFPVLGIVHELVKDGCKLAGAVADLSCPKVEDLWQRTGTTAPTTPATTPPADGAYTGTLSGSWGTHAHHCSWTVTFSGPFTLELTSGGGTAQTNLQVTWSIVNSNGGMCSGFGETAAATGEVTGSASDLSIRMRGTDGYALDIRLQGSATGTSASLTGTVQGTLWEQYDQSDLQTHTANVSLTLNRA
jgi:hypothetical protein